MSTLSDQAFSALKDRLAGGRLGPGTVLSERQVARELGMSKTPVRAAFARLESQGLVEISPQRGVVVSGMSLPQLADCFELRAVLETYVLRKLAGRLTAEQRRELQRRLKDLRASLRSRDTAGFVTRDMELHLAFARFLGNSEIERVMEGMRDRISLSIIAVLERDPDRLRVGHDEHEQIVAALTEGDADRAAVLMQAHLDRGKQSLYPRNL